MKIYVIYSYPDNGFYLYIKKLLEDMGYVVSGNVYSMDESTGIYVNKTKNSKTDADVYIAVISQSSFKANHIMRQLTSLGLEEFTASTNKVIPVILDGSPIPSYLQSRIWIDLSTNYEIGLESLFRFIENIKHNDFDTLKNDNILLPNKIIDEKELQLKKIKDAYDVGNLALMCGAGVSVEAGIPSWSDLLTNLLKEMIKILQDKNALVIDENKISGKHISDGVSSLILGKYLKNNLGDKFDVTLRDVLYKNSPKTCDLIDSIIEMSRPNRDGRSLNSIITFNFDGLIEEKLAEQKIPHKAIFSESIAHSSNELPIYHVHGYLPRKGKINSNALVFSEDGYHSQFMEPYSWSNMIQLQKLTQQVCLFIGISLTDPNMRRLLDVAWRKNTDNTLSHYMIKKRQESDDEAVVKLISLLEEQDANALGINVIWVDDFDEIPNIINGLLA